MHRPLVSQMPALRTLGNIVTGTDAQTQVVLDYGILPSLYRLLFHQKFSIVRVSGFVRLGIPRGGEGA